MTTRYDRWSKADMPTPGSDEFQRIQRGIDATMRAIVASPHIPTSASMIPDRQRAAEEPRAPASGGTAPLAQPPGVNIIDQMVEEQSRKERLRDIQNSLINHEIERRLASHDPHKAKTRYHPLDGFDDDVPDCHRAKDD